MKPNAVLPITVFIAFIIGAFIYAAAPAQTTAGLWHGTFDINGRGNFNLSMLQVGNRLVGISEDAKVAYQGMAQLDDDTYSATFQMYFINGNPFDEAHIEGLFSVGDNTQIDARFLTKNAGDKGQLKLTYLREQYERPIATKDLASPWILYQGYRIIKLDIDADGRFTGGDTDGCEFKGSLRLIEEQRNAFEVALLVSSCDRMDGEFSGLSWLSSSLEADDTLNIQVFEDSWSIFMPMVRNKDTTIIDDGKKPI